MKPMIFAAAFFSTQLWAQAKVVQFRVTTFIQEGVMFPELEQCFLYGTGTQVHEVEDVFFDLQTDKYGNDVGAWNKSINYDNHTMEFRIVAVQNAQAAGEPRIQAQIYLDQVVETSLWLDMEGKRPRGVLKNVADALFQGEAGRCYTANIMVEKPALPSRAIADTP